ncbi:MAG: hypothetical protein IKK50_03255 [Ruminiclostridium sp.]|nr:hypothetical protein [Ruminiclostridium sp.]
MAQPTLHSPLSQLPGIGPAREAALAKLGLCTVADLLAYFPRDYEDRTVRENIWTLPLEEPVCFAAMVAEPFRTSYIRKGMELTKALPFCKVQQNGFVAFQRFLFALLLCVCIFS